MVKKEEFSFTSAQGSTKIRGVRWIPEKDPVAVVQLAHGMTEYIDRYAAFAEFLAAHDILVVGNDHLGHGQSVQSDDDLGYFAEENGDRVLVQDMLKIIRMTKKEYPDLPYIMFGHSMGSFLTRLFICCHGSEVGGAIICGTGNNPAGLMKAAMGICRIMAKKKGWRYRSDSLYNIMFGVFNKRFAPTRTECDWLSRNEASVDAYVADEKCGFRFTLNGYYNLFMSMWKVVRKEYLERMPKDLPVLFISGDKDPVGGDGKGVQAAVKQFKDCGMKDVECILYEGDRHEILNELDRETVYADVLQWICAHFYL